MLTQEMTVDEIAFLIQKKRGLKQRAAYFQAVFQNMWDHRANKDDPVAVRFGILGEAYAPNYMISRASDNKAILFWGTYHRSCDDHFPEGWDPANLTARTFSIEELSKHRLV